MKGLAGLILVLLLAGCASDDLSLISIRNHTEVAIFTQAYSSEFAEGDWILPGAIDEFYSINCDCLDGFEYFSFYYDSLIVYLKDHDDDPIKFYKDGSAVNYDATLNPFTNPDVWRVRKFESTPPGAKFNSTIQEQNVSEHYFCISMENIKSLNDTIYKELNPAL